MQSKHQHLERLTLAALDAVIEMVRDAARRQGRGGSRQLAEQLGAVNEFLLRPIRQTVSDLAAGGLSNAEPSPLRAAEFSEPVADQPLSVQCPKCHAARGMECRNYKMQKKSPCRERKRCVDKYAIPDHPAWKQQPIEAEGGA